MPRDLVRTGSLVLALLGGTALSAGNAVAQQQPPAAEPQQQEQQEKAQQLRPVRWARRSQARTRQVPRRPTIRCSSTVHWRFPAPGKYRYRAGKVFREERCRRQAQHRGLHVQAVDGRAAPRDLHRAQGAARRAGLQCRYRR